MKFEHFEITILFIGGYLLQLRPLLFVYQLLLFDPRNHQIKSNNFHNLSTWISVFKIWDCLVKGYIYKNNMIFTISDLTIFKIHSEMFYTKLFSICFWSFSFPSYKLTSFSSYSSFCIFSFSSYFYIFCILLIYDFSFFLCVFWCLMSLQKNWYTQNVFILVIL